MKSPGLRYCTLILACTRYFINIFVVVLFFALACSKNPRLELLERKPGHDIKNNNDFFGYKRVGSIKADCG